MRRNVDIAELMVMPNHVHGIIAIGDGGTVNRVDDGTPRTKKFGKPTSNTISTTGKTMTKIFPGAKKT